MNISMVVCTYNRVDFLKDALDSLINQSICKEGNVDWEIIVIDNNSTDNTSGYVKDVCAHNDSVRYVLETKQGIGNARNAALNAARYDIVAYIDDDETADINWAKEIIRVFEENDDVGCVGGPYILEDEEKIPCWIPANEYYVLSRFSRNIDGKDYADLGRSDVWGGNMSLNRKACLEKGLSFPAVGRKGKELLCGEDSIMSYSIYDAGFRIFYTSKAIIYHKLMPERLTLSYFIRFYKGLAQSKFQKGKIINYIFEILWSVLVFPFRVLLDYKRTLKYFNRIVVSYYKFYFALKELF